MYRVPDDAWGLDLWREPLPDDERGAVAGSCTTSSTRSSARRLDVLAARGPFVVLDLHSYNHRRDGADAPPAPVDGNPEVNVGTGSLDRDRWGGVVDRFIDDLGRRKVAGHRSTCGRTSASAAASSAAGCNERYADRGCALAIEFKKVFMDEWTGDVDEHHLEELRGALAAAVPALIDGAAMPGVEVTARDAVGRSDLRGRPRARRHRRRASGSCSTSPRSTSSSARDDSGDDRTPAGVRVPPARATIRP